MTRTLKYVIFNTDMGWIGVLGSARGLWRTTLPQPTAEKANELLGEKYAIWSPYLFDDLIQRLRDYFSGHRVSFLDQLDLFGATAFQRRVWEVTRLIPYGITRSYTWVAEQIGEPNAVRAVGQALARNPLPIIIPCHRVVTSGGRLGGYSGGVEMKKHLLYLETAANVEQTLMWGE